MHDDLTGTIDGYRSGRKRLDVEVGHLEQPHGTVEVEPRFSLNAAHYMTGIAQCARCGVEIAEQRAQVNDSIVRKQERSR